MNETERRKAVISARETDVERWRNPRQLEASWEARAIAAAQLMPAGARVGDIGCGAMRLEVHLPFGCTYLPCDVVQRDPRTRVLDLNKEAIPSSWLDQTDIVSMLGVWEYLYEPQKTFAALASSARSLVTSYCPTDVAPQLDRRALGWVNDLSTTDFVNLAAVHGYRVHSQLQIDQVQYLFKFERTRPMQTRSTKRVHVLSCLNFPNFGDRLGYQLLCDALPPNVEVSLGTQIPESPVPDGIDLIVIGIGGSMFKRLLTDHQVQVARNAKAAIGIFGTQYREALPRDQLSRLLDNLTHWFARYEDDIRLYGAGRSNVSHLGDWLINAFPLAKGTIEKTLSVPPEIQSQNVSLDRLIQFIQLHRRVSSARLHPLLCALTSAEEVSYSEQRDGNGFASGKFRSMLIDIFDRSYPENVMWQVDRERVAAYKAMVRAKTDDLRMRLAALLN